MAGAGRWGDVWGEWVQGAREREKKTGMCVRAVTGKASREGKGEGKGFIARGRGSAGHREESEGEGVQGTVKRSI